MRAEGSRLMAGAAVIASRVQLIHGEYYGQAPDHVRVYEAGDVVVVLIEGAFTRAEQMLIGRGEASEVQVIRRRFEMAIADQFIEVVQTATGRRVRAFIPDTDLNEHLAVETFVLGEPVEDMTGFESVGSRADTEQQISDQAERGDAFGRHEN
jgi:uncharacterized protein YbcI